MGTSARSARKQVGARGAARKAVVRSFLTRASRESLAAEGIVYSDRQWRRMVSAARKAKPQRSKARPAAMADRKKISQSLTQAYSRVSARSSNRLRK